MVRIQYYETGKQKFIINSQELADESFDIVDDDDDDAESQDLSQKKTHYIAPFVNGFVIDGPSGDNILIVTTESLLIFDKYYER